ncbi:mitochondrial import inner membrane translocase subunit TIM44-like [Saccoglossus kowalevskii]|uniref:Mitochondrial import inner membrane translocase subunit TIM44 n=1 Tax=Saccoglossus kowalevskii TaxID=10224 RepID=A0ABM0GYX0_SACKO|nr:PREDICTED: mitochondrial import inner membrane translocase subunit TIM44-like [Saccoglossus kowalevskii]
MAASRLTGWRNLAVRQCVCNDRRILCHRPASGHVLIVKQHSHDPLDFRLQQVQFYSNQPARKSFLAEFIENVKQEFAKNKEMKDSIKKFREEADKLEKSDALQKARQKYSTLESDAAVGSTQLKKKLDEIGRKVSEQLEEVRKSDWAKKGMNITEDLGKTAKDAAESVGKQGEQIGKSSAFKAFSQSVKSVKEELDEATTARAQPYKAPEKLRKRSDRSFQPDLKDKPVEANEDATGMVLHKDSKWFQQWQNFKDNNQVVNKIFDLKMKYDESDNAVIRASRVVTDKVSQLLGGVFTKTEMSEVLTEIIKIDPHFSKDKFLRQCESEIIPNILEAMIRGDLDVLKDWCYEAPFNAIAVPVRQAIALGYKFDSKVLDIDYLELVMGKMMEQGPVLIISFQTQQIQVVRNAKHEIVEGDEDKVVRVQYVWVLCRDQEELNPDAAWKLLDLSAQTAQQWV